MFDITIDENRPRLVQKFQRRQREEFDCYEEDKAPSSANRRRVNNLSSLELNDGDFELLSKGPNFALTQKVNKSVILEAEKGVERLAYAKRWQDAIRRTKPANDLGRSTTETATNNETTTLRRTDPASNNESTTLNPATPSSNADGAAAANSGPPLGSTTRAGSSCSPTDPGASVRSGTTDFETANDNRGVSVAHDTHNRPATSARSGLSFRFPDTDKRYPPPTDVHVERKLKTLKEDIVKSYKGHEPGISNVAEEQLQFLDTAQKSDDFVFKQSDKCKGFVILDRGEYKSKSHAILDYI